MSSTYRTIQFRAAMNRLPCSVPYCTKQRFGASHHCQGHAKRFRKYGHPQGRRLLSREYAAYHKLVSKLFRENPDHPGLQTALAFIDAWFRRSDGAPAAAQLARLQRHCVTALEILEECAAVWALHRHQPHALPDDLRLDFALANAVFHLAPRELNREYAYNGRTVRSYRSIPRTDRRDAGAFIRQSLAVFLNRVASTLDQTKDARREELIRALDAPFHHLNLMIPHSHH